MATFGDCIKVEDLRRLTGGMPLVSVEGREKKKDKIPKQGRRRSSEQERKWYPFSIDGEEVEGMAFALSFMTSERAVLNGYEDLGYLVYRFSDYKQPGGWIVLRKATKNAKGGFTFFIPSELPVKTRLGLSLRVEQNGDGGAVFELRRRSEDEPFDLRPTDRGRHSYVNNLLVFPDDPEIERKFFEPVRLRRHSDGSCFSLEVFRRGRTVSVEFFRAQQWQVRGLF